MKFIYLLLSFLCFTTHAQADNYYLKISQGNGELDISYPPGSKMILKNLEGEIVLDFQELRKRETFEITEIHTLYVYPTYKQDYDEYTLKDAKLTAVLQTYPYHQYENKKKNYGDSNGVYILSKDYVGKDLNGEYNLIMTFSNGVSFNFIDGIPSAYRDGQEIPIRGRYVIDTQEGKLKISYNPKNGEMWYAFENYKQ